MLTKLRKNITPIWSTISFDCGSVFGLLLGAENMLQKLSKWPLLSKEIKSLLQIRDEYQVSPCGLLSDWKKSRIPNSEFMSSSGHNRIDWVDSNCRDWRKRFINPWDRFYFVILKDCWCSKWESCRTQLQKNPVVWIHRILYLVGWNCRLPQRQWSRVRSSHSADTDIDVFAMAGKPRIQPEVVLKYEFSDVSPLPFSSNFIACCFTRIRIQLIYAAVI
jgi:hypothetical protein